LKAVYDRQDAVLDAHNWNTIFLSNHDNPRLVSSFGDDSAVNRAPSAKLLATMLLTLKGTPFIYQGDELAMTNYPFQRIEDFDDIEVKNAYKADVLTGKVSAADYFANQRKTSRDNARTPMQWDSSPNAGFSTAAKPWLPIPPSASTYKVETEKKDPNSIFNAYKTLLALHRSEPALRDGDYTAVDKDNPNVFSFLRRAKGSTVLVSLNMSAEPRTVSIDLTSTGVKGTNVVPLYTSPHSGDEAIPLDKIPLAPFGVLVAKVQ